MFGIGALDEFLLGIDNSLLVLGVLLSGVWSHVHIWLIGQKEKRI